MAGAADRPVAVCSINPARSRVIDFPWGGWGGGWGGWGGGGGGGGAVCVRFGGQHVCLGGSVCVLGVRMSLGGVRVNEGYLWVKACVCVCVWSVCECILGVSSFSFLENMCLSVCLCEPSSPSHGLKL